MIRARTLSNVFKKRSIRPYYAHSSAVPYACFVDTADVGSTVIYPGMVATKTTGEMVTIANAEADVPFGLFGNFINGDLDELFESTETSVWRGGADATFEILADALDATVSWTSLNGTAGGVKLYHNASGKLTNVAIGGTQLPVARLVEANSNSKIKVSLALNY